MEGNRTPWGVKGLDKSLTVGWWVEAGAGLAVKQCVTSVDSSSWGRLGRRCSEHLTRALTLPGTLWDA